MLASLVMSTMVVTVPLTFELESTLSELGLTD